MAALFLFFFSSFHLTFQGLPNFIKSPEDQTGISGGVASFVCQAAGEPKPRITWMKKGKKVSSQRFEVTVFPCLSLACQCLSYAASSWCLSSLHHQAFAQQSCFSSYPLTLIYSLVLPSTTSHPSVLSLYSLRPISYSICVRVWSEILI